MRSEAPAFECVCGRSAQSEQRVSESGGAWRRSSAATGNSHPPKLSIFAAKAEQQGALEASLLAQSQPPLAPGMEGIVDVTMTSRPSKPTPSAEAPSTDWQSVVKDMLSIHLPSSKLQPRPINTDNTDNRRSSDFSGSQSYKNFASLDPEPLRSGSPRASRSPMAVASPRSSGSGLFLLRIDESQALDTSSDCGSDLGDPVDLAGVQEERMPRRSRLASDSGHVRASDTGRDAWDVAVAREEEEAAGATATSPSQSHPAILESDMVKIKGLQIRTSPQSPQEKPAEAEPAKGPRDGKDVASLAKYRPSTSSLGKMAAVFPTSHARKMRRSVVHRISDHGGSSDAEGRLRFEEERLELEGLKRDVEASVGGKKLHA